MGASEELGEWYDDYSDLHIDSICPECGTRMYRTCTEWVPYGDTEVPITHYFCPKCNNYN